jgi:XTP/dITP diphosphohydrolase
VVDSILIATTNPGKLREIVRILDGLPYELKTLADFPGVPVAEETGASFADNARQKALHYAGITGMVTLAEDSGFEIDALDGEPGIHSARYLREDATYAQRFADIYRRVRERVRGSAREVCVRACGGRPQRRDVRDGRESRGASRRRTGRTAWLRVRSDLFLSAVRAHVRRGLDEEKTAVSHRGQAIRAFRDFLTR